MVVEPGHADWTALMRLNRERRLGGAHEIKQNNGMPLNGGVFGYRRGRDLWVSGPLGADMPGLAEGFEARVLRQLVHRPSEPARQKTVLLFSVRGPSTETARTTDKDKFGPPELGRGPMLGQHW